MLAYWMIWEGTHRTLIYFLIAVTLWVSAWGVYLKPDFKNWLRKRKPHKWGVDMETKSVTSGPKGMR